MQNCKFFTDLNLKYKYIVKVALHTKSIVYRILYCKKTKKSKTFTEYFNAKIEAYTFKAM